MDPRITHLQRSDRYGRIFRQRRVASVIPIVPAGAFSSIMVFPFENFRSKKITIRGAFSARGYQSEIIVRQRIEGRQTALRSIARTLARAFFAQSFQSFKRKRKR